MNKLLAIAAIAISSAAYAADTATPPNPKPPAYAAPVIADADAMKGADQMQHSSLRQQLTSQLQKAGYTDVTITPSSFYVVAKDKKGDPVAMIIGPDSVAEVTDIPGKTMAPAAQPSPNADVQKK